MEAKIEFHLKKWFVNAPWWYWKPHQLNSITWEKGDPKIYRWLFFGWIIR